MEKKKQKQFQFKKILLLLTVLIFAFALTGCNSVSVDKGGNGYVLRKREGLKVYSYFNEQGGVGTGSPELINTTGSLGTYKFTKNYEDAKIYDADGSVMRDVARLMLKSTFGDELIKYDSELNKNKWEHFTTEPKDLIKKVNTATTSELQNNEALANVVKVIKSTASAILITVWAMGFISQIVNEKFTMETLLKTLMQLMCGILIVMNADIFTEAFVGTGNLLLEQLSGVAENTRQFDAFKQELTNMLANIELSVTHVNLFDLINVTNLTWSDQSMEAIFLLIFPFIMQLICAYKIVSMLIMRTFEIMIRTTFAPIPLAFSAQNGFSEGAIRYFRGIFACALQPVLMIVGACCLTSIATIVMQIFGGGDANNITGFTASIAMGISYFILSTFLGQVKQLSNEVIAH